MRGEPASQLLDLGLVQAATTKSRATF